MRHPAPGPRPRVPGTLPALCVAVAFVAGPLGGCALFKRDSNSRGNEAINPLTNDPDRASMGLFAFERDLFALPRSGKTLTRPWAEDYWPSWKGGIQYRWFEDPDAALEQDSREPRAQSVFKERFRYTPPTKERVAAMTLAEKKRLSPAEKYSILKGDYSYDLVMSERERLTKLPGPRNETIDVPEPWKVGTWEGLCHAWTPASVFFEEPAAVEVANADGVVVPFGASDVKALMLRWHHDDRGAPGDQIFERVVGGQCQAETLDAAAGALEECTDTNAGAFHIILANTLGRRSTPIFADLTNGRQIWNYPVFAYRSRIVSMRKPSPGAAVGTANEAIVSTEIDYVIELRPRWEPIGADEEAMRTRRYLYSLELSGDGEILGGSWLDAGREDSTNNNNGPLVRRYEASLQFEPETLLRRPDNLWMRGMPRWVWPVKVDRWVKLEELYGAALAAARAGGAR